jgi:hypothetical protein
MKSIFKSKTFWFNILTIVAASTGVLPITPEVATIVNAAVNVGLRTVTTQSVSFK